MASRSIALSLKVVGETLAISWPTVVDAALGRVTKESCDARLGGWCKRVVAHLELDLHVRGRERLDRGATYLVMSNHQSHYDVPVLYYVLGPNLRMVAKKELFGVPIFGAAMRAAGFIEIDRQNRDRAIESLEVARTQLARGTHVWIAPEGTRSESGELLPFKKGPFALALGAGLPVLPVTIAGTRDALPAHGTRSSAGARVKVTLHEAIDPEPFATMGRGGRDALLEQVRAAIASGL
jgi:1-acyl-sn-glycerol-3-phosphate acyltransferase